MKFSVATEEQLYQIAMDDSVRLIVRYAAAKEIQTRKNAGFKNECQYPLCHLKSDKPWGLVPLCKYHHEMVESETVEYYEFPKDNDYSFRYHYLKIAGKIPWSWAKKEGIV